MKVAVITRHAITNYGSLLQAFATQRVIENLGYECEIIDYIREDESYAQHERTLLARKPTWNSSPIKKAIYLMLRQPESIAAGRRFEKAQIKYLKRTKRYCSAGQLKADPPIADIYMTGSDQVWGPTEDGSYDDSYCLSFTKVADKRISYAASFGHANMTQDLKKYFGKWLSRYEHITVREDSAVKLVEELGLKTKQVIDPTLLLEATDWSTLMKPVKSKKYVLVYQLHNDVRLGKYAQAVAKDLGLPLMRISSSFHQTFREGKFVWCPEVGEFLSYIKNAECMITDSFHGTAFAINFNTPFVEVLPNNNTRTRNISILKMTGLSDRILTDDNNIALAREEIDFLKVNQIIDEKRKDSLRVLKEMLEN